MGKSLEAGAEDGEISQEDIVGEVVAGTVTAATLLAGRGLNNFFLKGSRIGRKLTNSG